MVEIKKEKLQEYEERIKQISKRQGELWDIQSEVFNSVELQELRKQEKEIQNKILETRNKLLFEKGYTHKESEELTKERLNLSRAIGRIGRLK